MNLIIQDDEFFCNCGVVNSTFLNNRVQEIMQPTVGFTNNFYNKACC